MEKMAVKLNVSIDSIYNYMKMYGIPYSQYYQGLYDCDEDIFKEESERAFYLAGFIAADGSLQDRGPSTKVLKICLSEKDASHLHAIRRALNSNHPIHQYLVKPSELVPIEHYCVELCIVSKPMFNDLAEYHIVPAKTFIYTFPAWMSSHPLRHHYMRGYFDGDGCASHCGLGPGRTVVQKHFNLVGTKSFVSDYMLALVRDCDLNPCTVGQGQNRKIWSISYSGNGVTRRIREFLYQDATIFLARKRVVFP